VLLQLPGPARDPRSGRPGAAVGGHRVPALRLSAARAALPVRPSCSAYAVEALDRARGRPRQLARRPADRPLPPLPPRRARPGAAGDPARRTVDRPVLAPDPGVSDHGHRRPPVGQPERPHRTLRPLVAGTQHRRPHRPARPGSGS
jgi:hypothetical protein